MATSNRRTNLISLTNGINLAADLARSKTGIGRTYEPGNRAGIVPGHLEPDTFYINDILLRIPPTEIHVDKQAFNHEWSTLRTQQIRQTKSGYSLARVGFEVIFKNGVDFSNLVNLVAGLRATPFCTIRNEYLSKTLGRPDATPPTQGDFEPRYRTFQPIMLGLTSMSFSTMGHEGKPDCIRGMFDFIWFNYLPYTPIIAYKTGEVLESVGEADQSPIWRAFYEPFLRGTKVPVYPHPQGTDPTTLFMWREFALLPKGDPGASRAALELVKAAKGDKSGVLEELKKIQGLGADGIAPSSINSQVLDILLKKLIKNGSINPDQDLQDTLNGLGNTSVTDSSGGIVGPALQKLGNPNISTTDKQRELDSVATILAEKIEKEKKARQSSQQGIEGFQKILDTDAQFKIKNDTYNTSGMELWGRKKFLNITHQQYGTGEVGPVVQQITVSFENSLASIPMVGYMYPTLQHLGAMNTRVNILINARNYKGPGQVSDVESICRMYDSIETMALHFRQIPQGFGNLFINNDFLQMFGIRECLTNQITTTTVQGQPGRSLISLTLSENGIQSGTKLQDNPEAFSQVYGAGNTAVYKECWNIIRKYLVRVGTNKNSFAEELFSPADAGYYYFDKTGVKSGDQNRLMNSIVRDAANAWFRLINTSHGKLFSRGLGPAEANMYKKALDSISENDPIFGWTPGLNELKDGVDYRTKTLYNQNSKKYDTNANDNTTLQKEIVAIQKLINTTTDPTTKEKLVARQSLLEAGAKYNRLNIIEMGIEEYKTKMIELFQKVIKWGIDLGVFSSVKEMKDTQGLGKGLFAYPDFKEQISSVAAWCGDNPINNSTLMKYEPDCYFWYPAVNGGQSSPSLGLIDPLFRERAKKLSTDLFSNAKEDVGKFFSQTYVDRINKSQGGTSKLVSDNLKGYANPLKSDRSQLAPPLYDGIYLLNSIAADPKLTKSAGHPDPDKIPTQQVTIATNLSRPGQETIAGSTDLNQLWGKIDSSQVSKKNSASSPTSSGPTDPPDSPTPRSPQPISPGIKSSWGSGITKINDSNVKNKFIQLFQQMEAKGWQPSSNKDPHNGWGSKGTNFALDIIDISFRNGSKSGDSWQIPSPKTINFFRDLGQLAEGLGFLWGGRKHTFGGVANINNGWASFWTGRSPRYRSLLLDTDGFGGMGDMLHVEWVDLSNRAIQAKRKQPPVIAQQEAARRSQAVPGTNVASTVGGTLDQSINEFEKELLLGQGQSMMRAYPTFKLYFIEDRSGERRRFAMDDFFSYNAVQSIRVVKSRKIAADLCEIFLTNVSGVLSNRRFRQDGMEINPLTGLPQSTADKAHDANGDRAKKTPDNMKGGTRDENPIASLLLQEGIDIHLKLGYSSDPDRLDDVFTGTITEIEFSESDDLVRILAQSHAIELVQDIKGVERAETKSSWSIGNWTSWILPQSATTAKLLTEFISSPEVVHFGRWKSSDGISSNKWREILTDRWTYEPQPQDDNIFAPSPTDEMKLLGGGIALSTLNYVIYRTTIWDIFQEMTLRHPNFIASPVPYKAQTGWRMTMFYGLPNQLYFARDPNADEELVDERLKLGVGSLQNKTLQELGGETKKTKLLKGVVQSFGNAFKFMVGLPFLATTTAINSIPGASSLPVENQLPSVRLANAQAKQKLVEQAASDYLKQSRQKQALTSGFIKPFRSYHLVTSKQHIIANNITANARDVANTIVIKYGRKVQVEAGVAKPSGTSLFSKDYGLKELTEDQTFILKLDTALPPEEIRAQVAQFINVDNEEVAKRYALGLLIRNLKEVYKGELIILGNGKVKPFDICYVLDEYTDMLGAIEVEEVQHVFDQQMGFRTEIKPDMLVQAGEWSLLTSAEALGVISEEMVKKMGVGGTLGLGIVPGTLNAAENFASNFGVKANLGRQQLSILPWIMGQSGSAFGGFLGNKILTYTQLAYPVVMSPLQHHGRPFAGGVPTRKLPISTWTTFFGKWSSNIDVGYQAWLEDLKAGMMGWIVQKTGQTQLGDFWNSGGDNPIQ